MNDQHEPQASPLRTATRYTWILIVVALLYVGWIFYSRKAEQKEMQRAAQQKQLEDTQKVVDTYGGNNLKLIHFYVSPAVISKGQSSQLCYGIANAKTLTITNVENVWPSLNRCIDLTPAKTTTYTLNAEDAQGHKETQSVTITVQ